MLIYIVLSAFDDHVFLSYCKHVADCLIAIIMYSVYCDVSVYILF